MNKLFKKAAAFIAGAVIAVSSIGTTPVSTTYKAYAEASETAAKPEVLGYTVMSIPDPDAETPEESKPLSSITANKPFELTINVMDRLLKGSDADDSDIIFTKSMGSFKCEAADIQKVCADSDPLKYTITLKCTWLGGSNSFAFMIGYSDISGDFTDLSFAITECRETTVSPDPTPDTGAAEPIFKINASGISDIKAGERGMFTL